MDTEDDELQEQRAALELRRVAAGWLAGFEAALASGDAIALGRMFHADAHWRDVLAFTWHVTPLAGADAIVQRLLAEQGRVGAHGFMLPAERRAPRLVTRLGTRCIEALYEFSTAIGGGAGIFRLSEAEDGLMKAWLISTTLQSITGHEERIGAHRPSGSAYSRNFGGDNWADVRRKAVAYADRDPAVLVVGGAQAGLAVAARLNRLGVDTLVVEKWPRIGDSWRKRYHSLALHNSIHINHLPYMPFPPSWPTYVPKDMLGNWFEFYADAMEINCWTDTEFAGAEWDSAAQCWNARLKHGDGSERVMRPRHIVCANGVSSYPMMPDVPGLDAFQGTVMHSEGFDSGAGWGGKRALILGTGSSANDMALDLHSHGVHTTMIQRGSTTVVSINPSARLNEAVWDEPGTMEDADVIASSVPPPLVLRNYRAVVKRMMELDREIVEGLRRIGFKHDIGEDETGHQMKYFRRGGGYNLDAGSSELLIKGEIGLLQYDRIDRFVAEGALLYDGSLVPADLVLLATGYYPQQELIRRSMGEAMVERIGPVWGIGADGELNNMYKRTPQQGLWFIAGGLPQCRINSKFLALQIKAMELGLLGPL
jgi:putative flavoprotein involved in K+ transport